MVVAALVDSGADGVWADGLLSPRPLAAPHLMPAEATNILRRASLAGDISADAAGLAHGDLTDLRVDLFAFDPLADRIWALRSNLTSYDAWYVALAESLAAPLATLDLRLVRSPGPRCEFLTPSR